MRRPRRTGRTEPGTSQVRTLHRMLTVGSLAALAAMATGCGRATDVTVYEPGVYKGADDPLLARQATPEHKALLKERFSAGQTDR